MKPYHLLALLPLFAACSNIGEDERLISIEPLVKPQEKVQRAVLIEDFTGQRCTNCPEASAEVHRLQEHYGDTAVIAVGIHAGELAFSGNARYVGLRTETGDRYYDYWKLDYMPVGLINRSAPLDYTAWSARVYDELQKTAPLRLDASASLSHGNIDIRVEASGVEGTTTGKLQLWLVEDSIVTFQFMPDGSRDYEYEHQHVFRTTINCDWGDDISVAEAERVERTFALPLSDEWVPAHLSVVAFVYNDDGVQQVTKTSINIPE